jgi:transcriptional regulator with XRE-family HTH domain
MNREQFLVSVGTRIRQAREKKNMSLFDLAAVSGISKRTLIDIEHGKVNTSITNLKEISDALEVSVNDLLDKI